jgi:hypothetical protein
MSDDSRGKQDRGQPPAAPEEVPQPYVLTEKSFIGGIFRRAGEIVHLLPHQVGPTMKQVEVEVDPATPLDPPAQPALDAAEEQRLLALRENEHRTEAEEAEMLALVARIGEGDTGVVSRETPAPTDVEQGAAAAAENPAD